jgi:hypothetical protein
MPKASKKSDRPDPCVTCGGFRPKYDPHLQCKNCRHCDADCATCASITPTLRAIIDDKAAQAERRRQQRRRAKSQDSSSSSPTGSQFSLTRGKLRPPTPLESIGENFLSRIKLFSDQSFSVVSWKASYAPIATTLSASSTVQGQNGVALCSPTTVRTH